MKLSHLFYLPLSLRDAEDLLRDQTMGCFLIRLSEKIRGYILSYKYVLLIQFCPN